MDIAFSPQDLEFQREVRAWFQANTPEALQFVAGLNAFKRIAAPEEIAEAALFLCSPASSFTTGTAMLVDGGVSINRV